MKEIKPMTFKKRNNVKMNSRLLSLPATTRTTLFKLFIIRASPQV